MDTCADLPGADCMVTVWCCSVTFILNTVAVPMVLTVPPETLSFDGGESIR